ncbi:MAG: cytochrome P450 [Planctomycetota bacterium]|nr:cytochrome P450 [Planctomycetota bacterium]MDA1212275.1 cytochrome P450 [Planctomycetota bacterium]
MSSLRNRIPGLHWLTRLPGQLLGRYPFAGDIEVGRVPLFAPGSGRPTVPFPHPWNYDRPIRLLDTFFWKADDVLGTARHNRYLDVPGFAPVLVTRDPRIIRAVTTDTGDKEGQFDRDTLPSVGIARATGKDTLLFANGAIWRRQRKLAAPPFGKTTLFQPEQFLEFAETFRHTVRTRLDFLEKRVQELGHPVQTELEPEIKAVMLEMLTNNFFGTGISYDDIRNRYVPALERVIDHIVRDTVINKIGVPVQRWPSLTRGIADTKTAYADFEQLTDIVLAARPEKKGLWRQFKSDAPDDKLRSNVKVFLAGALEATTSYASWAISHLARNPEAQAKVYEEVKEIEVYTPETLDGAKYLGHVLDETLRLTPSLYFLPRRATADTWIETSDGKKLWVPRGTHLLLDVWHANRHDDHWGVAVTGYPAGEFVPERWEHLASQGLASKEVLHFGFGHGPRVCPGKHLGQLEVGLVVGAFVKLFRFKAMNAANDARAGVSTKPLDGTLIELESRRYPLLEPESQPADVATS